MFILHHSSSITSISTVLLLFNSSSSSSSPSSLKIPYNNNSLIQLRGRRRNTKWMRRVSGSVTVVNTDNDDDGGGDNLIEPGSEVVRNFYARINVHDVDSVQDLISDNCVYEDLVFPRPFVGRQEILEFFKKFTNATSIDLQFVIDDLSTQDSSSVGVIWHLEWKGKPFPFSKGCSFYRLEVINGKRQIVYARDSVEPAIKPGDAALAAIRSVTWLLQQFPQLADRL
ncbi:PREDICTED: uncharacterized protein LOC109348577 isoform X1 [Lupinus angustifolius]|uniref:uncharacterized protein LOC109348577 isoform X1 n=1 Tax=Lupinus angustifolius TaxID=3871 RepID=UPI00092F0AEB|nr:PREDICTED: uncharacterized protein LOC109348577 isoform X1 [Lupinus angustifolius]